MEKVNEDIAEGVGEEVSICDDATVEQVLVKATSGYTEQGEHEAVPSHTVQEQHQQSQEDGIILVSCPTRPTHVVSINMLQPYVL